MSLTLEQKQNIVVLRAMGWSYHNIATEIGVSKETAIKHCYEDNDKVLWVRQELLEEVVSKARLLLKDRLESLGELVGKVREELASRNLTEVSTLSLVRMYCDLLKTYQNQNVVLSKLSSREDSIEGYYSSDPL